MNDLLEILNDFITGKITEKQAAKKIYELKLPKKETNKTLSVINNSFMKYNKRTKIKIYAELIIMFFNLLFNMSITFLSIYILIILIKIFS